MTSVVAVDCGDFYFLSCKVLKFNLILNFTGNDTLQQLIRAMTPHTEQVLSARLNQASTDERCMNVENYKLLTSENDQVHTKSSAPLT